ncbi:hypothetical protein ROLI_008250 [Roseobacter fucihabitans]|uniref:Lipoprotein n=1 Tax=Roseobacter fucihabitans TaxID=1537242 RepID=A0ABZ2BSB9_9RHOB|nr:hypothetical protein [Roseobacter litoralis]MBC6966007.1 hypothetical protein [Roseobacter litoralis]
MTDHNKVRRPLPQDHPREFEVFDNPVDAVKAVAAYLTAQMRGSRFGHGTQRPDTDTPRPHHQDPAAQTIAAQMGASPDLTPAKKAAPPSARFETDAPARPENIFRGAFADLRSRPKDVDPNKSATRPVQQGSTTAVMDRVTKADRAELKIAQEAALKGGEMDDAATIPEPAVDARPSSVPDVSARAAKDQNTAATHGKASGIAGPSQEDFSRIMAQVDQHLREPEAAIRRNAFSHLRAAAAARSADHTIGETRDEGETTKPYRGDLAEAIPPLHRAARTCKSTAQARAPVLKLNAEQRVDMPPDAAPTARVDYFDGTPAPSFADFAKHLGCCELPDFIEAAAAYLSFVEGHAHFSRSQLMTQVEQARVRDFSREEGLRAFGTLLRTRKIDKLSAGQFTAVDTTDFHPARYVSHAHTMP